MNRLSCLGHFENEGERGQNRTGLFTATVGLIETHLQRCDDKQNVSRAEKACGDSQ